MDSKQWILAEEVISSALSVVSARHWAENHPEDPHHGDSVDLANDQLEEALREYKAKAEVRDDIFIQFYLDDRGEHRWRVRDSKNHQVMGTSAEGYKNKADIEGAVDKLFGPVSKAWV